MRGALVIFLHAILASWGIVFGFFLAAMLVQAISEEM